MGQIASNSFYELSYDSENNQINWKVSKWT
jgi:hypothetical protein